MAEFRTDVADPVAALAGVGVAIVPALDADASPESIASVIPDPERQIARGAIVAQAPAPGAEFSGMGAWHINDVNEAHTVTSGRGYIEFVTNEGVVGVVLVAGDVMLVQRAEHRYLPLESQGWVIRHGGELGADLAPVETGRENAPWPSL